MVISDLKGDFGGECVSMVNDWHAVISIPAVQLHAPTALKQNLKIREFTEKKLKILTFWLKIIPFNSVTYMAIKLNRGLSFELMTSQVGVVRRLNVVI